MLESQNLHQLSPCEFRSAREGGGSSCAAANALAGNRVDCLVQHDACTACQEGGSLYVGPNIVTVSLAIGALVKVSEFDAANRLMRDHAEILRAPSGPILCVLRGPEVRQVACKPCQAGSLQTVTVSAFRCPKHSECTLSNTGHLPRIQACSTCLDRLSEYPPLKIKPTPPEVLQQIQQSGISQGRGFVPLPVVR